MRGNLELLALARDVATVAGDLILKRRGEGVSVAATKSSATDIVTHADAESETLIRSLLADARPDDGFLGEESDATGGTSGLTWVVDPIDGTANYLYGIPHYAVSIGVVEGEPNPDGWTPLAAVVVDPAKGETYTAAAGHGAFFADRTTAERRLAVNTNVQLASALIGTGFGYSAERRQQQARLVSRLIGGIRDIRRAGTASLDLCSVASGRLDGFFERGLQLWDFAAGGLIATEAGARVGGLHGRVATSEMLVAAEPGLFAALEAVLVRFDEDDR